MSSAILRSVMKSVKETTRRSDVPRRNFVSSSSPLFNYVDRLLTWAVRATALAGGGVIGYRIGGDPGGDRERCWQKDLEFYHEHKHLNCDFREEIKWYNEHLKNKSTPQS